MKKVLDWLVYKGFIINDNLYFTSDVNERLWSVDLKGDNLYKIPIPVINDEHFFIDNITGFGDFLYVAAYYNDNNHIISVDLKTYDITILTNGLDRVWKLCTDGETLYAYDSIPHKGNGGRITVIDLKN